MTGITYTLEAADTGGSLFAYTDAAAKDVELAPEVAALAVQKGIKVYQALFPSDCSSTNGFDRVARCLSAVTGPTLGTSPPSPTRLSARIVLTSSPPKALLTEVIQVGMPVIRKGGHPCPPSLFLSIPE